MRLAGLFRLAGLILALACLSGPAKAHIVASRLGDFYAGGLHPLTDLRDPIIWIAAGVIAAAQGIAAARWLVVLFPAGLLAGLYLATSFGAPGAAPLAECAVLVLLGGLMAAAVRMHWIALFAIVFIISLQRGAANAAGMSPETNVLLFSAGFAAAGYIAITLTMAAAATFRKEDVPWRNIAIRACGSWIAAIGLMVGGYTVAFG